MLLFDKMVIFLKVSYADPEIFSREIGSSGYLCLSWGGGVWGPFSIILLCFIKFEIPPTPLDPFMSLLYRQAFFNIFSGKLIEVFCSLLVKDSSDFEVLLYTHPHTGMLSIILEKKYLDFFLSGIKLSATWFELLPLKNNFLWFS